MNCQIVVTGTGGQGVLFCAGLFSEVARGREEPVLGSQTYGVSQRGGSVVSHLKVGEFESPLVREGAADLLLGVDCLEAHRCLPFLRGANGSAPLCVVNAPAGAFPDARVAAELHDMGVQVHSCDADAVALAMGKPLAANLVLIGYASAREGFPFSYDELAAAAQRLSSPRHAQANLDALARGRAL